MNLPKFAKFWSLWQWLQSVRLGILTTWVIKKKSHLEKIKNDYVAWTLGSLWALSSQMLNPQMSRVHCTHRSLCGSLWIRRPSKQAEIFELATQSVQEGWTNRHSQSGMRSPRPRRRPEGRAERWPGLWPSNSASWYQRNSHVCAYGAGMRMIPRHPKGLESM